MDPMRSKNWTCEDLRKSTTSILLNTLLLLLLAGSYIPQIRLLLDRRSTAGITSSYVLFMYLFTATQFTLVLLYSIYTIDCIADQRIRGIDAYGALIGLIQTTALWIGSITVLVLFLLYPNQTRIDRGVNTSSLATNQTTPTEHRRYPKTILSTCILHACLWVFPAIAISIPWVPSIPRLRDLPPFHPIALFIGFTDILLLHYPTLIVLVTSIFPLQIKELITSSHHPISELSLSPWTLALQTTAFILLGVSRKIDYGRPGDPFNIIPPGCTQPWAIYRLGAWRWVNNLICGVGQGVVLLIYLWLEGRDGVAWGYMRDGDETTALL